MFIVYIPQNHLSGVFVCVFDSTTRYIVYPSSRQVKAMTVKLLHVGVIANNG